MSASKLVIERLLHFARDPDRPRADDNLLIGLLVDVLAEVDTDRVIRDETLAVLYGVATELFGRVRDALPAPIRCAADGSPVWTEQQVADALGMPLAQVRTHLDALEAEGGAACAFDQTHALN